MTRDGFRPHLAYARFVTELFARRAQRATLEQLARYLTESGVPSAYRTAGWTVAGVRCVLANRVYLGELHNGEFVLERARASLTDAATWQLAHSPRPRARASHRRPTVLGGLVRCGTCGRVMQSHSLGAPAQRRRAYVCRRDDCAARVHISGIVIEPYVEACFFALLEQHRVPAELEALENEAARAHQALVSFRGTDEHIRAALTVLLSGRSSWPTHRELSAAGYAGLYAAMARRGRRAWEAEFGYADRPGIAGDTRWSESNVLVALSELTRERETYPSRAQFQVCGP
jgi:Recombinase zinc beta ribbon domain/Recombinase